MDGLPSATTNLSIKLRRQDVVGGTPSFHIYQVGCCGGESLSHYVDSYSVEMLTPAAELHRALHPPSVFFAFLPRIIEVVLPPALMRLWRSCSIHYTRE